MQKIEKYAKLNSFIKLIIFSVGASQVKKNFCYYCRHLFSKLVPHLEQKHKDETEVKMFRVLSKGKIIVICITRPETARLRA
jgi:hypothetical protein